MPSVSICRSTSTGGEGLFEVDIPPMSMLAEISGDIIKLGTQTQGCTAYRAGHLRA